MPAAVSNSGLPNNVFCMSKLPMLSSVLYNIKCNLILNDGCEKKNVRSELFHGLMQEMFHNGAPEDRANLLPSHLAFLMFLYYIL